MTIPAPPLPEADVARPTATPPAIARPARDMSSPRTLVAVVGIGALFVIACVLGVAMSGLVGFVTSGLGISGLGIGDEAGAGVARSPYAAPSARVPSDTFPDGQWLVAADIRPGTYSVTVPAGSPGCTWERNASTDGTASSVLETGTAKEGEALVVSIKDTDKVFQSHGCGTWQRTAD